MFRLSFLLLCVSVTAADELDTWIENKMKGAHIPSISAAVVRNSTVLWQKSYGNANDFTSPPLKASPDTPYLLASISKTWMATTLMTLYEKGMFGLDDPINDYLKKSSAASFTVVNPHYPKDEITFRMLLTHTSSISDNEYDNLGDRAVYTRGKDCSLSLRDTMYNLFAKGGKWAKNSCFSNKQPAHHFDYSNIGAALAGYMVEILTGQDFAEYSMKNVVVGGLGLDPVTSNWHLNPMNQSTIAMPEDWKNGQRKKYCQFTFIDYPDGGFRTTSGGLARHLQMFMQFGEYNGTSVLNRTTCQEMRRDQSYKLPGAKGRNQGLIWFYDTKGKYKVLGHDGDEMGTATQYFFHVETNTGVVILMNENETDKLHGVSDSILAHLLDHFNGAEYTASLPEPEPKKIRRDPAKRSRRARMARLNTTSNDLCDF